MIMRGPYSQVQSVRPIGSSGVTLKAPDFTLKQNGASVLMVISSVAEAQGYKIYRSENLNSPNAFTFVQTVTSASFTDVEVSFSSTYYYYVAAFSITNGVVFDGKSSPIKGIELIPTDTTQNPGYKLPVPEFELKASTNKIEISIRKPMTKITGVQIYRSSSLSPEFSYLATTATTDVVDTTVIPGVTYYYKLVSFLDIGTERNYSEYSPIKYAVVPLKSKIPSPAYTLVQSQLAVLINIDVSNTNTNYAGFEIYRSGSPNGPFSFVGVTNTATYRDLTVSVGTTYYYMIVGFVSSPTFIYSIPTIVTGITIEPIPVGSNQPPLEVDSSYDYKDPADSNKIDEDHIESQLPVLPSQPITTVVNRPDAPTHVVAKKYSMTSIYVSWGGSAGAVGYEVWRWDCVSQRFSLISDRPANLSRVIIEKSCRRQTYAFAVRSYIYVNGVRVYSVPVAAPHKVCLY
jgi:fibronectin type 3 domain-containing protein